MKTRETKRYSLPGLAKSGHVKALFPRIPHNIPQIQKERLSEVVLRLLPKAALGGEQRVGRKAQRGIVEAQRLEILPGGQPLSSGKTPWQPGHQEKDIRLLHYLVSLEAVKAYLVIAGLVPRL